MTPSGIGKSVTVTDCHSNSSFLCRVIVKRVGLCLFALVNLCWLDDPHIHMLQNWGGQELNFHWTEQSNFPRGQAQSLHFTLILSYIVSLQPIFCHCNRHAFSTKWIGDCQNCHSNRCHCKRRRLYRVYRINVSPDGTTILVCLAVMPESAIPNSQYFNLILVLPVIPDSVASVCIDALI